MSVKHFISYKSLKLVSLNFSGKEPVFLSVFFFFLLVPLCLFQEFSYEILCYDKLGTCQAQQPQKLQRLMGMRIVKKIFNIQRKVK